MPTEKNIQELLSAVEHPEIARTLQELGMLRDIKLEGDTVALTVVLPFLGIPEVVRNMIVESIREVTDNAHLKLSITFAEMSDNERQHFMQLSRMHWKGTV